MNETELLFTDILNCDRATLYQNRGFKLDREKSCVIAESLKRRIRGEPIQYILGKAEFMGLEFKVNKNVLIPRPETEILVETVMNVVNSYLPQSIEGQPRLRVNNILDIGTGSGCIAVSLAKFLPKVKVTAIDISKNVIDVAKENAFLNKVKINLFISDLFSSRKLRNASFEVIVSNPPYIPSKEIDDLAIEVRNEPRIALDGRTDGLDFYKLIAESAHAYLKEGGFLVMEMGLGQKKQIKNIFQKSGNFEIIEVVKDYNNIDRVIVIKKKRKNG